MCAPDFFKQEAPAAEVSKDNCSAVSPSGMCSGQQSHLTQGLSNSGEQCVIQWLVTNHGLVERLSTSPPGGTALLQSTHRTENGLSLRRKPTELSLPSHHCCQCHSPQVPFFKVLPKFSPANLHFKAFPREADLKYQLCDPGQIPYTTCFLSQHIVGIQHIYWLCKWSHLHCQEVRIK